MSKAAAILSCVTALAYPAINGWDSAWHDFHSWDNASSLISTLSPIAQRVPGLVYVPNGDMFTVAYSTRSVASWERWTYSLPSPYGKTLESGKYGVIVLFYTTSISSPALGNNLIFAASDSNIRSSLLNLVGENSRNSELAALTSALEANSSYKLVAIGPFDSDTESATYAIWQTSGSGTAKTVTRKAVKR